MYSMACTGLGCIGFGVYGCWGVQVMEWVGFRMNGLGCVAHGVCRALCEGVI